MLIAGVIALAAAQTVQAKPLVVPEVSVPQVSVPQVSVPQVSVPQVSAPAAPQVATNPLSNTPAPTRTQQRAVAHPQTGSRAASAGPAGSSSTSVAPGPTGDRKAGAQTPSRRARRIAREPSSKRLRRLLKPLAVCIAELGPQEERVLVRRAGLRGFKPQTRRELAKTLGTSRARVARLERRGLRTLRRAIRAGGCSTPASGAATPATPGTLVADRVSVPTESAGGGTPSDRVAVKGITKSKRGSVVETVAGAGRDALATIAEPARSFASDHPLTFALAVLMTLLCGVLFVRELRRSL